MDKMVATASSMREKDTSARDEGNLQNLESIGTKDVERQLSRSAVDHDSLSATSTSTVYGPTTEPFRPSKSIVTSVLSRVTSRVAVNPGPAPDGGQTAWFQCFCCWLTMVNSWGFVNSFGAFQTYYTNNLPEAASTISWIGSIQAFLMFFTGVFSGRALDAGLFRITVCIGFFFQLLGLAMMSLSTKFYQLFLTQGVLTGIGGGIIFCPVVGLTATYFAKRRGVALGIATTGNAIGGIVYPVVVRQLIPMVGFGWTVRVLLLINLVTLGFVVSFMKPRLPPRKAGPLVEIQAVRDLPYVFFVLGACCMMCSVYFVYYYIASFARDQSGLKFSDSVNLVIIVNGVGVPARILPGYLADRFAGPLNVNSCILLMVVILNFAWLGVSNIGGFYAWTVFYGMAAAGFQSLFPTVITSLGDDMSKAGTRLGMAFGVIGFAALVGGPIGGALIQADGGKYQGGIIWAALSAMMGVSFVIASRVTKYGWTFRRKC